MPGKFAIGWTQVAVCFVLLAAISMIASSFGLVAVPLEKEFGVSRKVLMLALTGLSLGSALISPLLGNLMDRLSMRTMMLAGALSICAGFLALSAVTAFWQVLVVYGVLMAAANVLMGVLAATVLLSRWFAQRRGTALGVAMVGVSAGTMIYPPLMQWLLDSYQWREALRWLALVMAVVTIVPALLVVNAPADRGLHPDGADAPPGASGAGGSTLRISAMAILADPAFWMIAGIGVVVTAGMKGMVANLVLLASDQGIAASDAAWLISLFAGCGLISKVCFAAVADRVNPRYLLIASLLGFGAGMAALTQAHGGYWAIAGAVTVIGLFGGMMIPVHAMLMPRIFGQQVVGRAMGMNTTAMMVVLLASPPAFGLMFDLTGSYDGIFYAFTTLAVLAIALVPTLRLYPRGEAPGALLPAE